LISAIVLAGGKSERMGRPKALLPFRGTTFLQHILDVISQSKVQQTVVVVGRHRDEIEPHVQPPSRVVFNADYEQGMITSLQSGIRELPPETTGALMFLVDHPVVDVETVNALIQHFASDRIVLPVFEGRRGHPVLFAAGVLQEIVALSPSEGANIVVRKDPGRIVQVSVKSPGVLIDIDTPEDYQNLLKHT